MPRVPDELFRAPKGVHDVLPPESGTWTALVARFADRAARFGYGLIVSPVFEHVEVFRRVGEHTDVVSKEMYEFEDKGGRTLALRPEGTASVVRAYVQHRPTPPWKVWYVAPNFRYERAQKGRYRQHWQLGAEALGVDDPALDVEVIALLDGFYRDLGLTGVTLSVNSMGDAESRPAYLAALSEYLVGHADALGDEFRARVDANPIRVLDTKVPEWQDVVERAPQLTEYLSDAARDHFEAVQQGLKALGIAYELDPRLVRGFDYYTRTTFEFQSDALDAAQNALGGGGRYDGLAEEMGGPPTPGIGFGAGIERLVLALEAASSDVTTGQLDAFVVNGLGEGGSLRATVLVSELREEGLGADRAYGDRSVSAQWKVADRSGARFGVMLGREEAARDAVAVKDLQTGEQVEVPESGLASWLNDRHAPGVGGGPMMRTQMVGTLRAEDVGKPVTLCGWVASRRDHGGVVFLDLRDASGLVQIVADPTAIGDEVHRVGREWVLRVEGEVRARPDGTVNEDLPTGAVEVSASSVEVLNEAEPPPFPLAERADDVDETLRLHYRYLDLRRPSMQRNLRLRATVNTALRTSMAAQGFVEIETPMLIASTPEGARDFVVPSRLQPGSFYALPQSPQLFKQLLMVGGMDKYFQIARCLRDEDLRADRQFEFMQYDAEMSFADQEDVMAVVTEAVAAAVEAATGSRPGDLPRMTWHEAMERFGTDKPDTRFGMELVDLGALFADTEFRAFQAEAVKGICVPGSGDVSRSTVDNLVDRAKLLGAAGLVWMRVKADGSLEAPVLKFLSEKEQLGIIAALEAVPGDLVLIVAGERRMTNHVLGILRLDLGRPPVNEGGLQLLWVVDFPLFEALDADGRPIPAHHPFTMPHPDDLELLDSSSGDDLLAVRSQAYDLVLNGWELGSGSVRIHSPVVQQKIFSFLGIEPEEAQARFGFLLDAFRFGVPPHAGFAFGVDRLVALLAGEENIREVIAFPKTQKGADPLTGAPSPLDPAQLTELGLTVKPRPVPKP